MEALEDVYERYREDPAFEHLRLPEVKLVPGYGAIRPKVMLCGEAPGATENLRGRPFCGPSGRALAGLMHSADLFLDDAEPRFNAPANAFITNVVKYRPPKNRTPTMAEIEASRPHLRAEWAALGRPRVIVCIGVPAHVAMRPNGPESISAAIRDFPEGVYNKNGGVLFFSQYHPAFGLRNPAMRPKMEQQWETMGKTLKDRALL